MTARDEVEKALMRWGRFELTMALRTAGLIISVQEGSGPFGESDHWRRTSG
jgi:hypothetical protein